MDPGLGEVEAGPMPLKRREFLDSTGWPIRQGCLVRLVTWTGKGKKLGWVEAVYRDEKRRNVVKVRNESSGGTHCWLAEEVEVKRASEIQKARAKGHDYMLRDASKKLNKRRRVVSPEKKLRKKV